MKSIPREYVLSNISNISFVPFSFVDLLGLEFVNSLFSPLSAPLSLAGPPSPSHPSPPQTKIQ